MHHQSYFFSLSRFASVRIRRCNGWSASTGTWTALCLSKSRPRPVLVSQVSVHGIRMAVARATSTKFQKGSLHTQATKTPYQKFSILVASGFRRANGRGEAPWWGCWHKYGTYRYGALGGLRYAAQGTVVTEGTPYARGFVRARGSDDKTRQAKKACKGT